MNLSPRTVNGSSSAFVDAASADMRHQLYCAEDSAVLARRLYRESFFEAAQRAAVRPNGTLARWAVDLRRPLSRGESLNAASAWFSNELRERNLKQICGKGFGSYLLVGAIAAREPDMTGLMMREERKRYGFRCLVEGKTDRRKLVCVVDDLLSSGRTAERVVKVLRSEGLRPTAVAVLFEFGWRPGRERLESLGLEVISMARLEYREPRRSAVTWLAPLDRNVAGIKVTKVTRSA